MNFELKVRAMGHKQAAAILATGRAIPSKLESCLRAEKWDEAKEIANPEKIEKVYHLVLEGAQKKIESEEKINWYFWAKPRGRKTSPDLGAERAFKEFYKGDSLTEEEKQLVIGTLAITIEAELRELKNIRDTVKI